MPYHFLNCMPWLRLNFVFVLRYLTVIEQELFSLITPREFLNQAWQKEDKATLAPNVTRMINRFNHVLHSFLSCGLWSQTNSPRFFPGELVDYHTDIDAEHASTKNASSPTIHQNCQGIAFSSIRLQLYQVSPNLHSETAQAWKFQWCDGNASWA